MSESVDSKVGKSHPFSDEFIAYMERATGMTFDELKTLPLEEQHRRLAEHTGKEYPLPICGDEIVYKKIDGKQVPFIRGIGYSDPC